MNKTKEKNIKKIIESLKKILPKVPKKDLSNMEQNLLLEPDKIEILINFLIKAYFEKLEMFSDSISDLKSMDLINTISEVKSAKSTFEMAEGFSDKSRRSNCIGTAQASLNKAIAELEDKALFYINKQRYIDNMNSFKKFLRGRSIITEIDSNNYFAKQALSALMAAISLQIRISGYFGDDIQKSVTKPYEDFKNKLLSDNTCLFMNDYDKDYSDEFWINLSESMDILNLAIETAEKNYEIEDDSIDYENIEFDF